jgi:hypothetical protein
MRWRGGLSGNCGPLAGGEKAAKTAGGRCDCRGVGEGLTGEYGQQRMRCLGQSGVAGAGIGVGQGVQSSGELALGVGAAPRVGVHEDGGDRVAELIGVGVGEAPGPPGFPGRGSGVHLGDEADACAPPVAPVSWPRWAGLRCLSCKLYPHRDTGK